MDIYFQLKRIQVTNFLLTNKICSHHWKTDMYNLFEPPNSYYQGLGCIWMSIKITKLCEFVKKLQNCLLLFGFGKTIFMIFSRLVIG